MKVLLLNGSPNKNGETYKALSIIEESLKETINLVKSRGERDNISAIVLKIEKDTSGIIGRIIKFIKR